MRCSLDRAGALRDPNQGKGGAATAKAQPKAQALPGGTWAGTPCKTRRGHHPECSRCPNGPAKDDSMWDQQKATAEAQARWYDHLRQGKVCGGIGHPSRCHATCLTPEARKAVEAYQKA